MESWVVGYDGDSDVERHAGVAEEAPEGAAPMRLARDVDVEPDFWAYDLRPGLPPQGLPRDEVYKDRRYPPGYVERMRQTAKESGIEMIAPPVVANTVKAHEATTLAREGGRLPQFHS